VEGVRQAEAGSQRATANAQPGGAEEAACARGGRERDAIVRSL